MIGYSVFLVVEAWVVKFDVGTVVSLRLQKFDNFVWVWNLGNLGTVFFLAVLAWVLICFGLIPNGFARILQEASKVVGYNTNYEYNQVTMILTNL